MRRDIVVDVPPNNYMRAQRIADGLRELARRPQVVVDVPCARREVRALRRSDRPARLLDVLGGWSA